jgi:hypothetical protein
MEQVGHRGLGEGAQLEGETAYAVRQAGVQMEWHRSLTKDWEGLATLVEQGRVGLLEEDTSTSENGSAEDKEADMGGEELEVISCLPQCWLRSAYVDNVLTYM